MTFPKQETKKKQILQTHLYNSKVPSSEAGPKEKKNKRNVSDVPETKKKQNLHTHLYNSKVPSSEAGPKRKKKNKRNVSDVPKTRNKKKTKFTYPPLQFQSPKFRSRP